MAIKGEDFVKDFDNYMSKILGSSKAMRLSKQAEKMRKLRNELNTKKEKEEFKKRVDRTQRQIIERRRKKTTFDQALAIARKLR